MNIGALQVSQSAPEDDVTITMMKKALDQNTAAANKLIESMEQVSAAAMERSVNPHIGGNIDVRL